MKNCSSIGTISGGQFQKTLIAFALLGNPNVLLFDEPTTSLDELAEERIYNVMEQLQRTQVVRVFPHEQLLLRMIAALLMETSQE